MNNVNTIHWIIDRFEGDFALVELEDGTVVSLPKTVLPAEAAEGDVIRVQIDGDAAEARKKRIGSLMNKLFAD